MFHEATVVVNGVLVQFRELWRHQEDAGGSGCGRRRCG